MSTIEDWLSSVGMSDYAQRFVENDIDMSVLRHLTDQDLKEIGVSLGHRRKILAAIVELGISAHVQDSTASMPLGNDGAERRQLTVMFCDLVGSTALATKLDPEDLREVVGAYHHCCAEQIKSAGGFVARYMGDGVLAYFGYPLAHEHDAERAVRAGLDLVQAVAKLKPATDVRLRLRVGIATGLVVVGDLIGEGVSQEHEVVGETPNLAARVQGLAEPETVVIADATRRLLGGLFEYRDLGDMSLKGFGDPVRLWQVTGLSTVDSRFEALRGTATPLIGRDEEIDLLLRRWDQAKHCEGCVVLISGEAGIGKSRIAQTLLNRLNNEPHIRLRYYCSPHHQDSALYPGIMQLERAANLRREDTDEQRLSKLEAVLRQATDNLNDVVPLMAELLSIPSGSRYPPLNLTPQKRKEKIFQARSAQLEGLASQQPVLVVYEDLHWSDPSTLESLDLLVARVATLGFVLLMFFLG